MVLVMNSEVKLVHSHLMDVKEAAEYLKLDEKTVSRWARKAYIPAHPLGEGKRKFWRFYGHELSAWLSAQFNGANQGVTASSTSSAQMTLSKTDGAHQLSARRPTVIAEPRVVVH